MLRGSALCSSSNIRYERYDFVELLRQSRHIISSFQLLATLITDDVMRLRRGDAGDGDVITARRRSSDVAGLTSHEIRQLTDAHNSRRRSVAATDMQLMVTVSPSLSLSLSLHNLDHPAQIEQGGRRHQTPTPIRPVLPPVE